MRAAEKNLPRPGPATARLATHGCVTHAESEICAGVPPARSHRGATGPAASAWAASEVPNRRGPLVDGKSAPIPAPRAGTGASAARADSCCRSPVPVRRELRLLSEARSRGSMRYSEIALRRGITAVGARAIGSAGERLVHTEEVTGSIPVSPTTPEPPGPASGQSAAHPSLNDAAPVGPRLQLASPYSSFTCLMASLVCGSGKDVTLSNWIGTQS